MTTAAPAPADRQQDGHLGFLDGWRGLAIAAVLIAHFLPGPVFKAGPVGVELFFVLSGRLMSEILFRQAVPLPKFYQRRISRIIPALALLCVVTWAATPYMPQLNVTWRDVWQALTFTTNYALASVHYAEGQEPARMAIGQVWSLCIEEHAYVMLSLVALAARRWGVRPAPIIAVIAAAAMINGVIQTLLGRGYFEVWWRTDARVGSIFASVAIYLAVRPWYQKRQGAVWRALPVVAAGVGLLCNAHRAPLVLEHTLGTVCLAFAVCTIDFSWSWVKRALSVRPLQLLGIWSYSLYLWQQPVEYFSPLGRHAGPLLMMAAFIPALASFYLVENPARRAINSWFAARRTSRGQAPVEVPVS